jgi:fermentation-respiration switch protein FrsA (DUF1100 family)
MKEAIQQAKGDLPDELKKEIADLGTLVDAQLKALRTPWFRFFLSYDPRPALARVRCPVLALVGEKDLQVPPRENLAAIEETLKNAGNAKVTVKQVPGVNHLFQTSTTGAPSEYATISETLAPQALETIVAWVVEQAKADGEKTGG